jgi:hypothetical protein
MHGSPNPLASASPTPALPFTFDLKPEGSGRLVLVTLAASALSALMVPFWLVAEALAAEPAARAIVAGRPFLAVELAAGALALLAMFGWPLISLAKSALNRRLVRIDGVSVTAEERGVAGSRTWTEPLSAYLGFSHRVRTSLSGVHHELVLVHPRPSRTVVVPLSARISREAVDQAARLLSIAEIPSREASNVRFSGEPSRVAEPQGHCGAPAL